MVNYNYSLISIITQADFIVQLVMLLLFIFSIFSWSIIIDKLFKFREIKKSHLKLEALFASGASLNHIYQQIPQSSSSPLEQIYVSIISECSKTSNRDESFKNYLIVQNTTLKNKLVLALEKNLASLANISSSSPFIGLFGTVWGIMDSFQSIALSQKTSLAVVAPGIAEALFATALGLFAAIPALIFCNVFNDKIAVIESQCENLITDLTNKLFYKQ